jgi:O-antigen/teichoic acid export membrane protein
LRIVLTKAIAAQAAGAGFSALVSFGLLAFLARAMGPESFGAYVAVLSTAILALILIEGGWPTLIYRETATHPPEESRSGSMPYALAHAWSAAAILATLAAMLALVGSATPSLALPPLALATALVCMALVATSNLISARLRGLGWFSREAVWQASGRVVSAGAIIAAVLVFGATAPVVFVAWSLGLVLVIALAGRSLMSRPRWDGLRSRYPVAFAFIAFEAMAALLTKGDVALFALFGPPATELSNYAACTRLTEAAILLFAPVSNVMLRSLRQAADETHWRTLAAGGALSGAAGGMIVLLFGLMVGDRFMPLVFGSAFDEAGALLPWVLAMLPFALASLLLAQALIARGDERALIARLAAGCLLLLVAAPLGYQLAQARGVAFAVAAAHALVCGLCAMRVWRRRISAA